MGRRSCYFAPGRVNLIGEHTDYNGGHVFPCALTIGTYAAVRPNDRKLRLYSANFAQPGVREIPLGEMVPCPEDNWWNYPKGVLWALQEKGYEVPFGFDLLVYGNIPNGSGLSSSASLEVLIGTIAKKFYGLDQLRMGDVRRRSGPECGESV